MNTAKQQYIDRIRTDTAYPTYRATIGVITILGYIVSGIMALGSLLSGCAGIRNEFERGTGFLVLIGGLAGAALVFALVRFWKEAALILADIGDSITDANSRPAP